MLIAFKQPTTLTVVTEFDEVHDNIVAEEEEFFLEGEVFDADVLPTDTRGFVDLQFGDGSVAFGVNIRALRKVK
jgi:hypothetical protein